MDDIVKKYQEEYNLAVTGLENELKKQKLETLESIAVPQSLEDILKFIREKLCPIILGAINVLKYVTFIPGLGKVRDVLDIVKKLCDSIPK